MKKDNIIIGYRAEHLKKLLSPHFNIKMYNETTKGFKCFENLFFEDKRYSVVGLKTETFNQYIKRCKDKYNDEFIFRIVPLIADTVYKEIEFKPSNWNLSVKEPYKKVVLSPNDSCVEPLKNLVLDLCDILEKEGIFNYLIVPDTSALDIIISDSIESSHSHGFRSMF